MTQTSMKMNTKALIILSVAHLITDINQGALPAMLPFFKEVLNLSYTTAGVILLCGNLTSSVIQPAFGFLSDKHPIGLFLPLAPLVACLGISLSGFMPNYFLLLLCVIVSGVGIASFHPEGFKTAHFFTGKRKATGMSVFAVGGNLGIALGPMWALILITSFGMKGTLGMALPGILIAGVLFLSLSWITTPVHSAFELTRNQSRHPLKRHQITSLLLLVSIVTVRSWTHLGLVSYIPFYYIDFLKGDPIYAGKLVSIFLMAGALGTLVGAPLADRWGHKNFLMISLLLSFPLLLLFYMSHGLWTFILIGIAGMVLISSFSLTVVMAQTLCPQHLGMVSGLMVGFAIGTGGIGVTLLGVVADIWGVSIAYKSIFVLPLIGFGLSFLLKPPSPPEGTQGDAPPAPVS